MKMFSTSRAKWLERRVVSVSMSLYLVTTVGERRKENENTLIFGTSAFVQNAVLPLRP